MATYIIGDVQGCYDTLRRLLDKCRYDPAQDRLGFVGDLVNRGPQSLEVLRFIYQLKNPLVVLGNHDFSLLALSVHAHPADKPHHLHQILTAPDYPLLINWLRQQPLMIRDDDLKIIMVHAGIPPIWTLTDAERHAKEVEQTLRGDLFLPFMQHLFGQLPNQWLSTLTGWDRLRYITNAFTRMRFCQTNGTLDLKNKTAYSHNTKRWLPWFQCAHPSLTRKHTVLFGHWAALEGRVPTPHFYGIDHGAVWHGRLTAYRVEDGAQISVLG